MHTPTPDPNGRPSSAKLAAAAGEPAAPGKGSTGSHRTAPAGEPSLSDLIRAGSPVRRGEPADDVAAHLAAGSSTPPPIRPAESTDDAPTVITHNGRPVAPPPPPYVVGEGPSVAGRKLGHFELIEAVGAGGMAAVLRARDLDLGRIVALKILPPESANDPENVTRFKQEARAAAKLDHENVARVYFCGEDQGLHFIAFEFVEGITLRQMIDRRGPLPAGECVRYMIQVAAGLNHAAERGVVHRDIKPSNIIITPDGRAKIVDMGLARHLDSTSVNGGVTQSGVTLGTFDYISPEQALDPRRADVRSDIYSLGCTFYHAMTGRPPVPEGTAAKKLDAHQHTDPLDPRELNPAIPDDVAMVLARMMAKNQGRRYQTPNELIAHLKGIAERLRVSVDSAITDSAVKAVAADRGVLPTPPRVRLGWVAAAAAVVAAVIAIVLSANGPNRPNFTPPWGDTAGNKKDDTPPPVTPGSSVPRADGLVRTAEELKKALADPNATKVTLAAGAVIDLTKLDGPVLFTGAKLELAGAAHNPPRVRLASPPSSVTDKPRPGTLTVRAADVSIHGIRFEIAASGDEEVGGTEPTGLAVLDAERVAFADCLFFPDDTLRQVGNRLAVLSVLPSAEQIVRVKLERCLFAPGPVALRVANRSEVTVEDSGFGPQFAAVLVQDAPAATTEPGIGTVEPIAPEPAKVYLERSTFMLDGHSAAVESDEAAPAQVTAGYCVFAPVAAPVETSSKGVVVRVKGTLTGDKVLTASSPDRRNVHYHVNALAASGGSFTFEECRKQRRLALDPAAWVKLDRRPWEPAVGAIPEAFASKDPYSAFRLRVYGSDADPKLFDKSVVVVGVQFFPPQGDKHRAYPFEWPPPAPASAEQKTLVWNPSPNHEQGEYDDLVKLLQDAKSGDKVLIRGDGPHPVEAEIKPPKNATAAERATFRLSFEAYPGSRPVLVPVRSVDSEVVMFKVKEGQVSFTGIEFLVKPDRAADSAAAVSLVAARGCTFKDCIFTLGEDDDAKAAAVVVREPSRAMMMDPAGGGTIPQVHFDDCLIRGRGRGVWLPKSRPVALKFKNTMTAVNGPVILAETAGRDPAPGHTTVELDRVTALLGGPLLELRAAKATEMRAGGLAPTDVTATACLFAAVPSAGKPLVEFDNVDPADVGRVLSWANGSEKPNWYANFEATAAAVVFHTGDEAGLKPWQWKDWLPFAREPANANPVGKVTFQKEPSELRELADVKPTDLGVKSVAFPDLTEQPKPDAAGADPRKVATPDET